MKPARLYSADLTVAQPVFTVAEPGRRCSWTYGLSLPIDVAQYPIAVLKYRATNISPKSVYTLRVDSGVAPEGCCRLFPGNEIVSDGAVHEIKKDLREFNVTEPLVLVAVGVEAKDTGPATLEVLDIHFDAPPDEAQREPIAFDSVVEAVVTDEKDQPVKGAHVSVDFERRNFVKSTDSTAEGSARIMAAKDRIRHPHAGDLRDWLSAGGDYKREGRGAGQGEAHARQAIRRHREGR